MAECDAATVTAHGGGEHLVGVHGLTGELRVSSADRQRGIITAQSGLPVLRQYLVQLQIPSVLNWWIS